MPAAARHTDLKKPRPGVRRQRKRVGGRGFNLGGRGLRLRGGGARVGSRKSLAARSCWVAVPRKPLRMSNHSNKRNDPQTHKKLVKANPPKFPGPYGKKETEVFVGSLPLDMKEEEMVLLFKDFGVKSARKHQTGFKSFGFLELSSPESVQLAIQQLNGTLLNGRRLTVAVSEDRRHRQPPKNNLEMPDLEVVHYEELAGLNVFQRIPLRGNSWGPTPGDPVPKGGAQSAFPLKLKACYAVPMEMRSSFLLHMLRDCFNNAGWLFSIGKVLGKAGLLVMDTIPQTPYFWAIHLTEECHRNMQKLFTSLAEVESQLPFLAKQDVQRGTRCLAECIVGDEGNAWNRGWVLDKVEDLAVVFFVDFGRSSTVPLNSLRKLDRDEFWVINPLAQPFMLQEDVLPPQVMMRQILAGEVVGPWLREPHILKFVPKVD